MRREGKSRLLLIEQTPFRGGKSWVVDPRRRGSDSKGECLAAAARIVSPWCRGSESTELVGHSEDSETTTPWKSFYEGVWSVAVRIVKPRRHGSDSTEGFGWPQ